MRPVNDSARSPCALRARSPVNTNRPGRHSLYPGGLKEQTAREVHAKHPTRLIEEAVRGMLPTNRMRDVQLRRLKVYAGAEHPHEPQKPQPLF